MQRLCFMLIHTFWRVHWEETLGPLHDVELAGVPPALR